MMVVITIDGDESVHVDRRKLLVDDMTLGWFGQLPLNAVAALGTSMRKTPIPQGQQ